MDPALGGTAQGGTGSRAARDAADDSAARRPLTAALAGASYPS